MCICLYSVIYDRLRSCLKECVSIQLFSLLFAIALYSSTLNLLIQLALLFYFVLYPVWFTSLPQDPIIGSSAAQRTEGRFVPVLGSTRSAATILGSYPRAQVRKSSFCLCSLFKLPLLYTFLPSLRMTRATFIIVFSVSFA